MCLSVNIRTYLMKLKGMFKHALTTFKVAKNIKLKGKIVFKCLVTSLKVSSF